MTNSIRDFRAASHLPPVSVCLVLAAASLILLCSRAETAGEPKTAGTTATVKSAEAATAAADTDTDTETESADSGSIRPEELRIWTWMQEAESQLRAGDPASSLATLRRAEDFAGTRRLPQSLKVQVQLQIAQSLDAAARHEEAVEVWWRLLSLSPRHDEVARGLASSLHASGRLEEARRVSRELLHEDFGIATNDLTGSSGS